jgi:hypothetical protein
MNKMYLVLGDWSDDGHGKYDKVLVESNKSVEEIQDAYKASCKLTGVSFNHNEDFTERKRNYKEKQKYQIATEYEQGFNVSDEAKQALRDAGFDVEKHFAYGMDEDNDQIEDNDVIFLYLWTEFVKLSLPDLIINKIPEDDNIPVINGYWDKNLNVQFGYGLYH